MKGTFCNSCDILLVGYVFFYLFSGRAPCGANLDCLLCHWGWCQAPPTLSSISQGRHQIILIYKNIKMLSKSTVQHQNSLGRKRTASPRVFIMIIVIVDLNIWLHQDVSGHIVLITGGGSGIGRLMCLKLVIIMPLVVIRYDKSALHTLWSTCEAFNDVQCTNSMIQWQVVFFLRFAKLGAHVVTWDINSKGNEVMLAEKIILRLSTLSCDFQKYLSKRVRV